jgi:amidase
MSTWITQLEPPPGDGPRLAVKDAIDVEGVVTTDGSVVLAEQGVPAKADAACVASARAAGARIVGKTNLHELCAGGTGQNPHFGTPRNPQHPARIPGGSSSGSAVAVATGEADIALGTDTAGSIRTPAACCGVAGLKTTFGRIPTDGVMPLAPSLDVVGPMARDVEGVIAGMQLLEHGFAPADRPVRMIGRLQTLRADPLINALIDMTLRASEIEIHDEELAGWRRAADDTFTILCGEAVQVFRELYTEHRDELGEDVAARLDRGAAFRPETLSDALANREPWRAAFAAVFKRVDLVALPGMPWFPPLLGQSGIPPNPAASPVNLAGHPALSIPMPPVNGLRPSLQLIGPDGSEERLVATGLHLQRAAASLRPPG